jgi:hypothetical protein
MDAATLRAKRVLEDVGEAKSPDRILLRSLLKSRNRLRAKYRALRAEWKRWRNQAAAVERSRNSWRQRALAYEAGVQEAHFAEAERQHSQERSEPKESESNELQARLATLEGAEKKRR